MPPWRLSVGCRGVCSGEFDFIVGRWFPCGRSGTARFDRRVALALRTRSPRVFRSGGTGLAGRCSRNAQTMLCISACSSTTQRTLLALRTSNCPSPRSRHCANTHSAYERTSYQRLPFGACMLRRHANPSGPSGRKPRPPRSWPGCWTRDQRAAHMRRVDIREVAETCVRQIERGPLAVTHGNPLQHRFDLTAVGTAPLQPDVHHHQAVRIAPHLDVLSGVECIGRHAYHPRIGSVMEARGSFA